MFNTLKRLFGRRVETTTEPGAEARATTPSMLTLAPGYTPRTAVRTDPPRPMAAGNVPSTLHIPLKAIISRLPADLMKRVREPNVGEVEIPISMQKILSQIAQGAVKISFAELRQISPAGTFSADTDRDRTLVDLPLQEVIARMNLALLPRRQSQKQVEVPPDVTGPFGGQCKVAISTAPMKPAPPGQPATRQQAPPPPPISTPSISAKPLPPVARIRNGAPPPLEPASPVLTPSRETPEPAPAVNPIFNRAGNVPTIPPVTPPSAPVVTPIAPGPAPAPAPSPSAPIPMPETLRTPSVRPPISIPTAPAVPTATKPAATPPPFRPSFTPPAAPPPTAVRAPASVAPAAEPDPVAPAAFVPAAAEEPATIPFTPPPPPAPPEPEQLAAGETRFLTVPISALSAGWPDAIKDEIVARNASHAAVGLPFGLVEKALKSGKIAYKWKTLRAWMRPPQMSPPSPRDATVLELPLKVVAPVFLGELNAAKPQAKVEVDEDIPDLFFDGSTEAAPGAPAPANAQPAPAVAAPPPRPNPAIAAAAPARQASPVLPPRPASPVPAFPAPAPAPRPKPASIAPEIPDELFAPIQKPATSAPSAKPASKPARIAPEIPDEPFAQIQPRPAASAPSAKPVSKPAHISPEIPEEPFAPIFTAKPPVNAKVHEDTNFFNRADTTAESEPAEEQAVFLRKDGTPGTDFLKRYATPAEIVNKAAALRGVDGALIALPDGLLVACKIPATMNADTIAAFLPQIFTKVTQCTRELRLGDLNNLNFTVGTVPWKIFKVGAIYFAAFGRPGEAMPTAQLAGLAAELDHKAK